MISRLRAAEDSIEIIVVDDDSPDRTWMLAGDAGSRVIRRTEVRGLASALRTGIDAARGKIVIWMDSDLSMPPESISSLIEAIKGGADIAVGSRYARGGKDVRPFLRTVTSRLINLFANVMLPVKVKDFDSGFVAVQKYVFDTVPLSPTGYGEYCIEFLCMAGLKGFRIEEVGFEFKDRAAGESKTAEGLFSFFKLGMQYMKRVLYIRRLCGEEIKRQANV